MGIRAVSIDNREPNWVKNLKFGVDAVSISMLDAGDIWVVTDDTKILVIERKTPDDFLNSLRDERLFIQVANLQELRNRGYWTYVMITGELKKGPNGHVYTDRETGWSWSAVQGAILSIQEMGVYVVFCAGDADFEAAIIRLAERNREEKQLIPPARIGKILGMQAGFLCGLPGIGPQTVSELLNTCGNPAWALVCLTDKDTQLPGIGSGIKNNVRYVLGLRDSEQLGVVTNESGDEILTVLPLGEQ